MDQSSPERHSSAEFFSRTFGSATGDYSAELWRNFHKNLVSLLRCLRPTAHVNLKSLYCRL